jgi:hypothetical protein
MGGIYSGNVVGAGGTQAPIVIVSASLPYRTVLGSMGFRGIAYKVNATEQASVTGI